MRRLIMLGLMAVTALPAAAGAQSPRELRRDRQELREDRQELREDRRELRRDMRDGASPREIREGRREVRQGQREVARDSRELRRDRSRYVAPYRGWTYRSVRPGYRLQRGFYGSRYIVSNYGRYRLGAPGYNRRWIRYGDDLVLVNIRNGRVIQVIRNRY
jgi:Ni/Co efflux regulator RcnB